jgi:2-oxoisovalerate dehydrogenase E1 component alpha subunit
MERKGWWDDEQDTKWRKQTRSEVLKAFNRAEQRKKPAIQHLFTDVYDTVPKHLAEQQSEMERILALYPDQYPLASHAEK